MNVDYDAIRRAFREGLASNGEFSEVEIREITFHLLDWMEELQAYVQLCSDPADVPRERVLEILSDFLHHAPHHIVAAAKWFTGNPVQDVFDTGAVIGSKK